MKFINGELYTYKEPNQVVLEKDGDIFIYEYQVDRAFHIEYRFRTFSKAGSPCGTTYFSDPTILRKLTHEEKVEWLQTQS